MHHQNLPPTQCCNKLTGLCSAAIIVGGKQGAETAER
jgi:hypothetical protein